MGTKTSQLQIRVTPAQKAALKRLATEAGRSVSDFVLAAVLPSHGLEFQRRVTTLRQALDRRVALADLASYLSLLSPDEFPLATADVDFEDASLLVQNQVAALVEDGAHRRSAGAPRWVAAVPPLERPYFGWELRSLRPHLMRVSPLAFKRRNIFMALSGDLRQ